MNFIVSLLFISQVLSTPQPPERLTGIVRDSSGLPMPGVEVVVVGTGATATTTTESDGRFQLVVAPGPYRITATSPGFIIEARDIVVERGAQAVEVTLRPAGIEETVIVTALRGPGTVLAAPGSADVITSRQIEMSSGNTVTELIRDASSLNVTQFSAREINVNARSSTGILANTMLVLVDGRSFFQPLYGAVYWDLLTVTKEELEQVEILRSPASALWGSNALNGVINLRTKSPRDMRGLQGHLGFGERGTKSVAATWADATQAVSYKVSGSYYEQEPWERDNLLPGGAPMPPTLRFENRGTKQPKVDARIDWDRDRDRVWSVRGGIAGANGLIHSALGPAEFVRGSYYSYLEVDRRSPAFDFKAYWNRLDAPFRIVLFGLDEDARNDTVAADVTKRLPLGQTHNLTFGGSLRLDSFDITIAPEDTRRTEAAVFLEERMAVTSKITVVAGGRVDKFDTTGAVFAPRLAVVITSRDSRSVDISRNTHSVDIAYNRAHRAPSLLENFVNVRLPAVVPVDPPFLYSQFSLGSTTLRMETQDAVEVGYSGVLRDDVTLSATLYTQRISNNIWFFPVTFYGPHAPPPGWTENRGPAPLLPKDFSFVNLGSVRDRGLELGARVERRQVTLRGSYTFQDTPRLKSGIDAPLQINRPPRHQLAGGASFVTAQWSASVDANFGDDAFWADVFTEPFWGYTDAFVNVNAHTTYALGRRSTSPGQPAWRVWVDATNLLDRRIKSHVFGDVIGRKVTAGIRWHWLPESSTERQHRRAPDGRLQGLVRHGR